MSTVTKSGLNRNRRGGKDYYGPYGWLSVEEAIAAFEATVSDYFEKNRLKLAHAATQERYKNHFKFRTTIPK